MLNWVLDTSLKYRIEKSLYLDAFYVALLFSAYSYLLKKFRAKNLNFVPTNYCVSLKFSWLCKSLYMTDKIVY